QATVKLGYLGALTGPGSQLSAGVEAGVKLAVSQYDGSDPAVVVQLDAVDTGGDPAHAKSAAMKLVADRVAAVIGPGSGDEAFAAEPVLDRAGIPSITVTAVEGVLDAQGWSFFHRSVPNVTVEGQADAGYIVNSLHDTSAAVLDDSTPSGMGLAGAVLAGVVAAGGTVAVEGHLGPGTASDARIAGRVVAAAPAVVVFGGAAAPAAKLLTALRSAGFAGKFLAGSGAHTGQFLSALGSRAAGSYISCTCTDTSAIPDAQAFNAAYLAQFGSAPAPFSAEAFDATNTVIAAVSAKAVTPAAIQAFLSTVDYAGITGAVKFQVNGDASGQSVYMYRVEQGRFVEIATLGSGS
ncbi:MAG TPA: branched-chain amino acid ABC transporter substrate-binding protein, partial [Gaiellales bacterium]|nr:branched-chain amino acid ABC transporter substrate-binding protein [Gaiellales bacterium]